MLPSFTQTNTFQSVIASDGSNTFVIFLYADGGINWTTGDANDGVGGLYGIPAQVGFDAGDSSNYYSVEGSFTDDIINVDKQSNVGISGLFVFQVNQAEIIGKIEICTCTCNIVALKVILDDYNNYYC